MSTAEIVVKAFEIVAAVAPGVLASVTGKATDAEAIAAAREAAEELPVRTGPAGTWEADLEARKRGGT